MSDIDATLEFRNNKLRFRHSTFSLKLTKSVTLKPKYIHKVSVTCRLPAALCDATLFVRPTTYISNFCASHMLLQFRNGYANLLLTNTSNKPINLCKDKLFAVIDLRYLTQMYSQLLATDTTDKQTTLYYHSMSIVCQTDSATKMHDSATKMRHTDIAKSNSVVKSSTISRDDLF